MGIHWPILKTLTLNPRRTFVTDDRRAWRGVELLIASMHIAAEIERTSESKQVGIMLPMSGAFPAVAMGAWMLGRTIVPLNFLLRPGELQHVVNDCETDVIVTARPMIEHLDTPPKAKRIVFLEDINFKSMPDLRWPARPKEDDLAALIYTSGTSGLPKGVMLSHHNLRSNIRQFCEHIHLSKDDVMCGVIPPFHSFGLTVLTLAPLVVGFSLVCQPRFVPHRMVRLIREEKPTIFVAIPSMYAAINRVKDGHERDMRSLRLVVSGGEPLPTSVADAFRDRFGKEICQGYGLSEMSPVTHFSRPEDGLAGTVGTALPDVTTRIVDIDRGVDLPQGGEGEIRLDGPNKMRGYFKMPEQTAATFDEHGHLRTGDIGRIDAQGRLAITGRLKEMMIVSGENVFPREIEEVLERDPGVHACGVVGSPDDMRGEVPIAFVEMAEGFEFDESALRTLCREHLASHKVPRDIRVIDEMPRNPTGKVLRRELKELLGAPSKV